MIPPSDIKKETREKREAIQLSSHDKRYCRARGIPYENFLEMKRDLLLNDVKPDTFAQVVDNTSETNVMAFVDEAESRWKSYQRDKKAGRLRPDPIQKDGILKDHGDIDVFQFMRGMLHGEIESNFWWEGESPEWVWHKERKTAAEKFFEEQGEEQNE